MSCHAMETGAECATVFPRRRTIARKTTVSSRLSEYRPVQRALAQVATVKTSLPSPRVPAIRTLSPCAMPWALAVNETALPMAAVWAPAFSETETAWDA